MVFHIRDTGLEDKMKVLREIADFLKEFGEMFPEHMYAKG